jgi:hypothetical protein
VNQDIQPDIEDPNNYCKSFKKTYSDKYCYCKHIRQIHKMEVSGGYGGKKKQEEIKINNTHNLIPV